MPSLWRDGSFLPNMQNLERHHRYHLSLLGHTPRIHLQTMTTSSVEASFPMNKHPIHYASHWFLDLFGSTNKKAHHSQREVPSKECFQSKFYEGSVESSCA